MPGVKATKRRRAPKGPKFGVRFYLVAKPMARSGFVQCVVTHAGQRVRFRTEVQRVPIEAWDPKKEHCTGTSLWALSANERLRTIRGIVSQGITEGRSLDDVQAMITGDRSTRTTKGIEALFLRFLAARKELAPATVKAFRVTLRALQSYEKATAPLSLASFQSSSPTATRGAKAIVRDLAKWLVNEYGYNDNTATKALRHLQTVIKWHVSEGLAGAIPISVQIENRDPIVGREKPALTADEVQALWTVELRAGTNLWHSRNAFVLACHTGQRYSDWHKIDPAKWREPFQIIAQQKTGHTARVLHRDDVRDVLRLYEQTGWPACITKKTNSAIVNEHIKTACKLAGLTRNVPTVVRRNGRDEVGPERPIYEAVTTHTARRTFVTIRQNAGDAEADIMQQTGMRSIATLRGYDKTTAEQFAERFGVKHYDVTTDAVLFSE